MLWDTVGKFPTPKDSEIKPMYPYALTKRLGEELVLHWEKVYGIRALSLRFFNVYGTRARTSGTYGAVFGVFLAQKLAKPFTIVGDGEQTRDFTYVTDVANAIKTVLEEGKSGHIYNVGSGKTVSINKIVELIGGPSEFIPKRPGEPDITFADIKKITSETSWRPQITIDEGVGIMLENISYWADAPVWDAESISQETKVGLNIYLRLMDVLLLCAGLGTRLRPLLILFQNACSNKWLPNFILLVR